jgi:hypothetical protein
MSSFYEKHLQSTKWAATRKATLKRDRNQCQTCLSTESLEVHHKTYERLGNEDLADLITLCSECHSAITEVIRRRRYSVKAISVSDYQALFITPKERIGNVSKIEVSAYIGSPGYSPQRANSGSDEQVCQAIEASIIEARQDGR